MRNLITKLILVIFVTQDAMATNMVKVPELWNVPDKKASFVNRVKQLEDLSIFFGANLQGQMAIYGLSGAGKTDVGIHFVHSVYSDYDVVWWFDAKLDLSSQYQQFALDWNATFPDLKDQIPLDKIAVNGVVNFTKSVLRKTNKSWLLIFDSVESFESISPYLPTIHSGDGKKRHILITTQNKHGWINSISLPEFSEAEAIQFATNELIGERPESIRKLVDFLSLLPIHMTTDIKYILEADISVDDYLKKYKKSGSRSHRGQEHFESTIYEIKSAHPIAYELMVLLSLKKGISLPKSILERFLKMQNSKSTLAEVLKAIGKGNFMQELSAANKNKELYSIHESVQEAVRGQISDEMAETYTNKLATLLISLLDTQWEDLVSFTSKNPEVIALANNVWELGLEQNISTPEFFRLGLSLMEYHMFKTRDHNAYETIFNQLRKMQQDLGDTQIPQASLQKFYINSVYVRGIYHDKALSAEVKQNLLLAVKALEESGDGDLYLRSLYNSAQYYFFCADLQTAKEYLKAAEPVLKVAKSISNIDLCWYVRSWVYLESGDYAECDRSLDMIFTNFDQEQNHAIKLYAMTMRANSYLAAGRTEEALKWAQESLSGAADFFQNENTEITSEALMVQAKAYLFLKNYKEAQHSLFRSLEIYEQYFGGPNKHTDQAVSLRLMGETYLAEGNYDQALKYFTKSMSIYTTLFGESYEDMNEVSSLLVALATLGVKTGHEELAQKYLRLHIQNFGANHAGTKKIFNIIDGH